MPADGSTWNNLLQLGLQQMGKPSAKGHCDCFLAGLAKQGLSCELTATTQMKNYQRRRIIGRLTWIYSGHPVTGMVFTACPLRTICKGTRRGFEKQSAPGVKRSARGSAPTEAELRLRSPHARQPPAAGRPALHAGPGSSLARAVLGAAYPHGFPLERPLTLVLGLPIHLAVSPYQGLVVGWHHVSQTLLLSQPWRIGPCQNWVDHCQVILPTPAQSKMEGRVR